MSQQQCPNCRQCAHFQVTFDAKAPVGCRQFGFKCRQLPSLEVLVTTGQHCIFWESKPGLRQSVAETTALPPGQSISFVA